MTYEHVEVVDVLQPACTGKGALEGSGGEEAEEVEDGGEACENYCDEAEDLFLLDEFVFRVWTCLPHVLY